MTTTTFFDAPESILAVDTANIPLMVMSVSQIHSQKLWHRGVVVLVSDSMGRLVLRRKKQPGSNGFGIWDVMGSGHVGSDEAYECAVRRLLPPELQEQELPISLRHTIDSGLGTGKEFVQVYDMRIPDRLCNLLSSDVQFLFVDQDELGALVANFPDQLSASLIYVWTRKLHTFIPN